ncbi:MAG: hypothetical protein CMI54_02390 [Parcubacteria group bacterium]|jgi:hypothetical protein|nr:hypothetical protein [Parcubacteria group bacterium]|tara:strand:+ start:22616 stop:22906 length:291 start_codon:yes stop_codon:yes gene_type:complete
MSSSDFESWMKKKYPGIIGKEYKKMLEAYCFGWHSGFDTCANDSLDVIKEIKKVKSKEIKTKNFTPYPITQPTTYYSDPNYKADPGWMRRMIALND